MPQLPVYYSDPYADVFDEFDMTFQIVLVGKDGIVLGSDRLFVERGLVDFMQRKRASYRPTVDRKFYVSTDELTVCAFAGGPYAETIARRIVTTCSPSGLAEADWRNKLELATKGVTEYSEQVADEVFVIRADNHSAVKIIRQQKDDPTFTPVTGHMFSGIETDAIILPKLFWRPGMECERLRTLAIVSIIQASIEAPHLIGGGIDIVVVNSDRRIEQYQYSQAQANNVRDKFISKVWEGIVS